MVAQMAERAPHDLKVVGSNPASGSYENRASKRDTWSLMAEDHELTGLV